MLTRSRRAVASSATLAPGMSLNPFKSLPNGREVWAWGMYDLANQSFQLLINTLLFSIYVAKVIAPTPEKGKTAWGLMAASAMLIVVVLSPIVGALADARAWKKRLLIATGIGAAACTALLALLGPGTLAFAFGIYITASVLVGLGENFLGSFLPELSTPQNVGRVSAIGWTMSYVGALGLLGVTAIAVYIFKMDQPHEWRWIFVIAGAWFSAGMLPSVFLLKERATPLPVDQRRSPIIDAFRQLRQSVRESAKYRELRRFFLAAFIYSLGTNTVIYFLGTIGDQFGFGIGQLTLMALVTAMTAGVGAIFAARYQDRLGHKKTLLVFLTIWVVSTLAMASAKLVQAPVGTFWFVAAGIGLGIGGIGTGSRALVGAFTPKDRGGEFFGVWGMVYKFSAVVGLIGFVLITTLSGSKSALASSIPLFSLTIAFALGAVLLLRVNEGAGVAAAGNGR